MIKISLIIMILTNGANLFINSALANNQQVATSAACPFLEDESTKGLSQSINSLIKSAKSKLEQCKITGVDLDPLTTALQTYAQSQGTSFPSMGGGLGEVQVNCFNYQQEYLTWYKEELISLSTPSASFGPTSDYGYSSTTCFDQACLDRELQTKLRKKQQECLSASTERKRVGTVDAELQGIQAITSQLKTLIARSSDCPEAQDALVSTAVSTTSLLSATAIGGPAGIAAAFTGELLTSLFNTKGEDDISAMDKYIKNKEEFPKLACMLTNMQNRMCTDKLNTSDLINSKNQACFQVYKLEYSGIKEILNLSKKLNDENNNEREIATQLFDVEILPKMNLNSLVQNLSDKINISLNENGNEELEDFDEKLGVFQSGMTKAKKTFDDTKKKCNKQKIRRAYRSCLKSAKIKLKKSIKDIFTSDKSNISIKQIISKYYELEKTLDGKQKFNNKKLSPLASLEVSETTLNIMETLISDQQSYRDHEIKKYNEGLTIFTNLMNTGLLAGKSGKNSSKLNPFIQHLNSQHDAYFSNTDKNSWAYLEPLAKDCFLTSSMQMMKSTSRVNEHVTKKSKKGVSRNYKSKCKIFFQNGKNGVNHCMPKLSDDPKASEYTAFNCILSSSYKERMAALKKEFDSGSVCGVSIRDLRK